jgi:hypothetical protein
MRQTRRSRPGLEGLLPLAVAILAAGCAPSGVPLTTARATNEAMAVTAHASRVDAAPEPAASARALLQGAAGMRAKRRAIQAQLFALGEALRDVSAERRPALAAKRDALAAEDAHTLADMIALYTRLADDPALAADVALDKVLFDLARALDDAGNDAAAASRFADLAARFPASPRAAHAHMALAERAFADERLGDAVAHCDGVLAIPGHASHLEALYLKAWSLRGLGDARRPGATEEAIAALEAITRAEARTASETQITTAARAALASMRDGSAGTHL